MEKILICVPNENWIHHKLASRLLEWKQTYTNLSFYLPNLGIIELARNRCVDAFMQNDFTHLFFIDSDTIPPADALEKMFNANVDIISAITPIARYDKNEHFERHVNAVKDGKDMAPDGTVKECDRVGSACIMIKKNVFESLTKPYYKFDVKDDGLWVLRSEDIYFCDKAKEKGFKIMVDTSIICQHFKEIGI